MDPLKIFIDRSTGRVRQSNTLTEPPLLSIILGTTLELVIAILDDDGVPVEVTVSESYLVVKESGKHTAEALLLDAAWASTGAGASARYTFETLADSAPLRDLLLDKEAVDLMAQIQWTPTGEDAPRRSQPFALKVVNSYIQEDEPAPDPADDASFVWLLARLLAGASISLTPNMEAKTITIAAVSPFDLIVPASDEATDLIEGEAKISFVLPRAVEIAEIYASLNVAAVGTPLTVDILRYNAVSSTWISILSAPLSLESGDLISPAASLSTTTFAKHERLRIDVLSVGDSAPGKGLKINISGTYL